MPCFEDFRDHTQDISSNGQQELLNPGFEQSNNDASGFASSLAAHNPPWNFVPSSRVNKLGETPMFSEIQTNYVEISADPLINEPELMAMTSRFQAEVDTTSAESHLGGFIEAQDQMFDSQ